MTFSAAWILLALAPGLQGDPAKDLRSKDHAVRLQAIEALTAAQPEGATKLLIATLKDPDWEVQEAALTALGKVGGKGADKKLLNLALHAPSARHRSSAAQALAEAFGAAGWVALDKKLGGKTALAAAEAAAAFAAWNGRIELDGLEKLLRSKETAVRRAAATALVVLDAERTARLKALWPDAGVWSRCEMLDALSGCGDAALVPVALDLLRDSDIPDVVERRARKLLTSLGTVSGKAVMAAVRQGGGEHGQAARVRLLADLVDAGSIQPADALGPLFSAAQTSAPPARAAIAGALISICRAGTNAEQSAAAEWLAQQVRAETDRAARGTALRSLAEVRKLAVKAAADQGAGVNVNQPADQEAGVDVNQADQEADAQTIAMQGLIHALLHDPSPRNREDAAVALAIKGQPSAVEALLEGIQDQSPWVQVVAAVSLGMTRNARAVEALAEMTRAEDWRLRGAAVIGLQRTYLKAAVPPIILALEDADPTVRRTAHETLIRIAKQNREAEVEPWQQWWAQVERSIQLFDPQELEARRKKYGYGGPADRDTGTLFDGFDVVVLLSRGDHIEHVLDKLGVHHRTTAYGQLPETELHPHAVCVVNCTGEIDASDVRRLGWFVRTGGSLLGSCWTLSMTIQRVFPGVLRKLPTQGEVMDDVLAAPCEVDSPYLRGVFPPGCEPRYALVGAHLIEVLDYERSEVLVDSPECAENWGEGNLAAWFPAGHGIILDSVNHFEEQGLLHATHLKKREDRQAYAIDHLGLRYDQLREIAKEKFWNKTSQAAREVLDLSVFRILTNFVREKRIAAN